MSQTFSQIGHEKDYFIKGNSRPAKFNSHTNKFNFAENSGLYFNTRKNEGGNLDYGVPSYYNFKNVPVNVGNNYDHYHFDNNSVYDSASENSIQHYIV